MKRTFDFLMAFIGLSILSPLLVIVGAIVFFDDGKPVFFKQERIGRNGRPFIMRKFRTMTNPSGLEADFMPGDTSRVTKSGKFFRRSKIDELPQLINVLYGDMSIVGPRPEVKKWIDVYPDRWAKILKCRPGITDNAAILFRNEEQLLAQSPDPELTYLEEILPRKLDLYEEYVNDNSLYKDIELIFKTVISIMKLG